MTGYFSDVHLNLKRVRKVGRNKGEKESYICKTYRSVMNKKKTKLRGMSPRANYTDRATTACRRR
jgi:hypothetical protein